MIARLLAGLLAASLVVALVGVAALSLRPPTAATAAGGDEAAESDESPCAAIQEMYWRVSGGHHPGKGLGLTPEKLTARAAKHGCELAAPPPDGWMPPADDERDGDEADEKGKGPPRVRDGAGSGPPWGNGWGQRLRGNERQGVCARLVANAEAHRDSGPPAGVKARLSEKFGCEAAEE